MNLITCFCLWIGYIIHIHIINHEYIVQDLITHSRSHVLLISSLCAISRPFSAFTCVLLVNQPFVCVVCVLPAVSVSLSVQPPCVRPVSPCGVFQAFVPGVPVFSHPALYSFFFFVFVYILLDFLFFALFGFWILWFFGFRICYYHLSACVSVHPDKSVFNISFLSVNRNGFCHNKLLLHPFLANLDHFCNLYRNGLALCLFIGDNILWCVWLWFPCKVHAKI